MSNLWTALIAARAEIEPFTKSAENPYFSSKYVPLDAILARVVPVLAKHGIALVGGSGPGGFTTRLIHAETGETVEDFRPWDQSVSDPQKRGAASSYSFRYGVAALCALVLADEDDDGNAVSGKGKGAAQGSAPPAPQRPATAPAPTSPTTGAAPPRKAAAREFVRRGSDCPACGEKGSVSVAKYGKNAGRWMCRPWDEKGLPGCLAAFDSDPAKAPEPEAAHDRTDGGSDDAPPFGDDDLPF